MCRCCAFWMLLKEGEALMVFCSVSTWPKVAGQFEPGQEGLKKLMSVLAGLIEVLATRDVFFVDADVTFKLCVPCLTSRISTDDRSQRS